LIAWRKKKKASNQNKEVSTEEKGLLDQVISSTKATERSRAEDLIRTLTSEVMQGTIKYDKNLTKTIEARIAAIDTVISKQLSTIMHDGEFQRLEGSWRGLHHLINSSETSASLKIKLLNVSKKRINKRFRKSR